MDNSYFFDAFNHDVLADISSHQLPTGNGYTQTANRFDNGLLTKDTTAVRAYRTLDGISWTASGGDLPATGSLVVYESAADVVVCCYDFGISALYDADYVGATSFTIDEDQTAWIETGMRVRLIQTTDASAAITGVSYSAGTDKTTISTTGVDSGLSGVYIGSVYNISDGTPLTTQPITLEINQ